MAKLKHTFSLDKFFDLKMLRKVAQRTPGTSVPFGHFFVAVQSMFSFKCGKIPVLENVNVHVNIQ